MPSPFPGIDPYLESQHFWEDFHPSFLTYSRDALNEILPGDYVAQLGERIRLVELSRRAAKAVRPDIAVVEGSRRPSRRVTQQPKAAGALTLDPVTIPLPTVETEVSEIWIEIRRGSSRTPVTVIELLSPTNKTGDGFVEYKLKRRSLIRQKIHLVELDLLLGRVCRWTGLSRPAIISHSSRVPNAARTAKFMPGVFAIAFLPFPFHCWPVILMSYSISPQCSAPRMNEAGTPV
jgi:Protein of unknown function (DUF4058)